MKEFNLTKGKIYVFDNELSDFGKFDLDTKLYNQSLYREVNTYDDSPKFFGAKPAVILYQNTELANFSVKKIKELFGFDVELKKVLINAQVFADKSEIHADSVDENFITVIYYANHEWKRDWGGETVFYNEEPEVVILPKYGRIVMFNSEIEHIGKSPERICDELRTTIALTYERVSECSIY